MITTRVRPGEVEAVLSWCRAQGVRLWLNDGQLRYEAPAGLLSADDLAYLRSLKPHLIEALSGPSDCWSARYRMKWGTVAQTSLDVLGPPLSAFGPPPPKPQRGGSP